MKGVEGHGFRVSISESSVPGQSFGDCETPFLRIAVSVRIHSPPSRCLTRTSSGWSARPVKDNSESLNPQPVLVIWDRR